MRKPLATSGHPLTNDGTQREKVPVRIFDDVSDIAHRVAQRIEHLLEDRQGTGKPVVLGLPTGSTPIGVYQRLIQLHREEGLDFSNVITFNIDEYYPMQPDSLQSYHRFMQENFFDHVNIPAANINIPDGTIARGEVSRYCRDYEDAIRDAGGLDLILLGIGRSGHIGFNEPGSSQETRTRLIVLDEITRKDAASDFFAEENVPREAITMGIGTIMDAREVILMALGEHKAPIVQRAVEEAPNKSVTASFLQLHDNAKFYVDRAAGSALTREETPWLVREVTWDETMAKRAVIWLSQTLKKAILHLEAADFYEHHLYGLINAYPDTDALCLRVFEDLRKRIMYRTDLFKRKKTILFSPHPDDDVISMGGMLDKVAANKNDVIVAYMTNGSVAVFDDDITRQLRFVEMSYAALGLDGEARTAAEKAMQRAQKFIAKKKPGTVDTPEIQQLKANLRYAEAIAGIEVLDLCADHARFLDMPFYKTGKVKKDPIGEADVQIVLDLLREHGPAHIFVAGDLSDPHGTHRMCYMAIREALHRYRDEGGDPQVWLYRGAWQEWGIHEADVFLPMSKRDLSRKIEAIFKHESQKDSAMFPGAYDEREFWQRARDRNRATAHALNALGLPEFYAAEAYVLTKTMD
ncbi:MAG: glucosamine-6-phosphate deaminase [Bacteroidota bacterium]